MNKKRDSLVMTEIPVLMLRRPFVIRPLRPVDCVPHICAVVRLYTTRFLDYQLLFRYISTQFLRAIKGLYSTRNQ